MWPIGGKTTTEGAAHDTLAPLILFHENTIATIVEYYLGTRQPRGREVLLGGGGVPSHQIKKCQYDAMPILAENEPELPRIQGRGAPPDVNLKSLMNHNVTKDKLLCPSNHSGFLIKQTSS